MTLRYFLAEEAIKNCGVKRYTFNKNIEDLVFQPNTHIKGISIKRKNIKRVLVIKDCKIEKL